MITQLFFQFIPREIQRASAPFRGIACDHGSNSARLYFRPKNEQETDSKVQEQDLDFIGLHCKFRRVVLTPRGDFRPFGKRIVSTPRKGRFNSKGSFHSMEGSKWFFAGILRLHMRVTLLFEGANLTHLGQGDKTIHEKRQYVNVVSSSKIFLLQAFY
jgi:hypothetical protein